MADAIRAGLRLEAIAADIAGDGDTALDLLRVNAYDIAFRELADTFDAMLTRLEAHVGEQQRFAANASHETAHPAGDHADTSRRGPQRSE